MLNVLKRKEARAGVWELQVSQSTRYGFLKSGRGTVKLETRYDVVCVDADGTPILGQPSAFHLTSKVRALKYFGIVTSEKLDALQRCNAIDAFFGRLIGE